MPGHDFILMQFNLNFENEWKKFINEIDNKNGSFSILAHCIVITIQEYFHGLS